MADDSRGRGILTKKDREFLADPETYRDQVSRQAVSERQDGIRQRIADGLLDLSVILEHLSEAELRKITGGMFGHLSEDELAELFDGEDDIEMAEALRDGIALLYLAAADRPENHHDIVEEGVRRAETRRGPDRLAVDVDLKVETHRMDWVATEALKKIKQDVDLTNAEVRALLETGRVPAAEVAEYIRDSEDGDTDGDEEP